jgi:hypothetical protein
MKTEQIKLTAVLVTTAILISSVTVFAAGPSPFVGHWEGIDIDGSDIRLSIGGPSDGPFQITWTESYISFCDGKAGILRGTGEVDPEDENMLEADLWVECFTTGVSIPLHLSISYHPATGALSTIYPRGLRVVFTHPGKPHDPPASLQLRANYQEDWVEGFYPEGYTVWITVTEADGRSIKATAQVSTGPVPDWDVEIGFSTLLAEWDPGQPEIEPNDWVYGWVDNGASAQMQVGEIIPTVDLENDIVQGSLAADWFAEEVFVSCGIWGYSEWLSDMVMPDGSDSFSCDFEGLWDLVQGNTAEVWYYGPDGHAVGHYIHIPNPHFTVFPEWGWLEGYEWPDGALVDVEVTGMPECTTSEISSDGFFGVGFSEGCTVGVGDEVLISDGSTNRTHTVQQLAIDGADEISDAVIGTADFNTELYTLHAWIHEVDGSYKALTLENGSWLADFSAFDLLPGMCGRVEINDNEYGNGTAEDWCVPQVFEWDRLNPDRNNPTPEHEVLGCEVNDGWTCTYAKVAEPELDFEDPPDATTGSYSGGEVTGDWSCPDWFEPSICETMTAVVDGTMTYHLPDNSDFDVGQQLVLVESDGGPNLYSFWPDWETYCPWFADFETALAANPFPHPFNGEDWPEEDCVSPGPPAMGLRVNYAGDWVESFYEEGHQVDLFLTESDGETIKAAATVFTAPRPEWGGEAGFQIAPEDWQPAAPDILPYDWVFASVDNGVSSQIQLGDIQGEVFILEDRIEGTVYAEWITDSVQVECLDWGSGGDAGNLDGGWILPDGSEAYNCAWDPENEWDIQPWQDIGVGYLTPDGHWVANAIRAEHWAAMWTYDQPAGFWQEGDYGYSFAWEHSYPWYASGASSVVDMTISSGNEEDPTQIHEGFVLLRPGPQRAWTGSACESVSIVHPDQPTRFAWGWMNDYSMPYEEALTHFGSLSVFVTWEGAMFGSEELAMLELMPSYEWGGDYICSLTQQP